MARSIGSFDLRHALSKFAPPNMTLPLAMSICHGNRESKVFSHRFGTNTLVLVVIFEGKGVLGILSFIRNLLLDFREIFIAQGRFEVSSRFYKAGGIVLTKES